MKITIYAIKDHLVDLVIAEQLNSDKGTGILETVSIYDPSLPTSPDCIYVVEDRHVSVFCQQKNQGMFIFTGKIAKEQLTEVENDYLILKEENVVSIFRRVQDVFRIYREWEIALYQTITGREGVKAMALTATHLISNPYFLYTASMKLVFCCNLTPKAEQFFESLEDYEDLQIEGEYVTDGFLDRLRDDPKRRDMAQTKGPQINDGESLGYRTLFYNIFLGGHYAARLLICETEENELKDGDFFVLKTLADFLTPLLGKQDVALNAHPENFDRYIQKLIAGEQVDETALEPVLEAFGWHLKDRYVCTYIPIDAEVLIADAVMSTCIFFEATVANSALIPYDDHLIHILNMTAMHEKRSRLMTSLARLYQERHLKAGVSPNFNDLRQLGDRCKQGEAAQRLGLIDDPKETLYSYENYDLKDLIHIMTEKYSTETLIPEEVLLLKEYDRANNMQLAKALKVYLQNDRNIARTIRVLYMQRATFLYQLRRITEITGIDLDDYANRLYLQVYFAAEEMDERYNK